MTTDEGGMKKKRQKLVVVQVATASGGGGGPAIVPGEGGSLEELLAAWRVVQIQPLGPPAPEGGREGRYFALLLLEEPAAEESAGRLGFGAA
jgi:hypothetical protein